MYVREDEMKDTSGARGQVCIAYHGEDADGELAPSALGLARARDARGISIGWSDTTLRGCVLC